MKSEEERRRKSEKKKRKKKKKKRSRSDSTASAASSSQQQSSSSSSSSKRSREEDDQQVLSCSPSKRLKKGHGRQSVENDDSKPAAKASTAGNSQQEVRPVVESSNLDYALGKEGMEVTLLLFYQYQEPPWSEKEYKFALGHAEHLGKQAGVTGRMRVAKEGFNCTLTGSRDQILSFCNSLRIWKPDLFRQTEFKLTNHLPTGQAFPNLKIIPVLELVHYGLEGEKAPPISDFHGQHLEPQDYHRKMTEDDTVMIDVRNHYEAQIGRFDPPAADWLDPNMRKSTEFPAWLDDPSTQEKLKGKQVLMYCTGGIRCERATALLKYKMEKDPAVQALNIRGVYQLQGGIDKYFKDFPDGGYWKGKNYVFDKRFAHRPPAQDALPPDAVIPLSKCEACREPWDQFKGKRRCPTCGVPSLICRVCWQAHEDGTKKLDPTVRCDLCQEQNIFSKKDLRAKEMKQIREYERRMQARGLLKPTAAGGAKAPPNVDNPDKVTRLALRNLCRKRTKEETLLESFPEITHIVWRIDHRTHQFLGQAWVEMATPEAAAEAVTRSGVKIFGRPIQVELQPPNGKDVWPPPTSAVAKMG